MIAAPAAAPPLLSAEDPPPGRLASLMQLELHALGHEAANLVGAERALLALDAGEQLRARGEALERGGERGRRIAPRDELPLGVANGLAGLEPPLRVVAGGRRNPAQSKPLTGSLDGVRVGFHVAHRIEREQRYE